MRPKNKDNNRTYTIYYLSSSEDDVAFYVGVTCNPIEGRLRSHRAKAEQKLNIYKFLKIREIQKNNFKVNITAFWKNLSLEEADIMEIVAIKYFRELGFPLTNISPGGNNKSEETALKISKAKKGKKGRPASEETKAKMSASQKGLRKPWSEEAKISIRNSRPSNYYDKLILANKTRTPEQHAEYGRRRRGHKHSQETIERIRKNRTGIMHTEETKKKMSISQRKRAAA